MKRYIKHVNTGQVKEVGQENDKYLETLLSSPSWFEIDKKGNRIPEKKKLNPVHKPPVFEKPKPKPKKTATT